MRCPPPRRILPSTASTDPQLPQIWPSWPTLRAPASTASITPLRHAQPLATRPLGRWRRHGLRSHGPTSRLASAPKAVEVASAPEARLMAGLADCCQPRLGRTAGRREVVVISSTGATMALAPAVLAESFGEGRFAVATWADRRRHRRLFRLRRPCHLRRHRRKCHAPPRWLARARCPLPPEVSRSVGATGAPRRA